MRLLPSIDLATRLTREGKLTEALAALTGGTARPGSAASAHTPSDAAGAERAKATTSVLRAGFDGKLGEALGRLGRLASPLDALGASLDGAIAPAAGLDLPFGRGGQAEQPPVPDGASFTAHSHVGPSGTLHYKLYRPSCAGTRPLPLVVMLHGCTQSPDDFAAGTRMNERAEAEGCYVAYPAQSRTANAQKCWNWFRAADQGRGGEPGLIAGMTLEIMRDERIDPSRVYVAGLSAGGAAAAVLGQTHPELFAAVGVHSGLACGAATDMPSAFAAMKSGALAPTAGAAVPTIVFHGDRDATVAPINGTQVLAQAEPAGHLTEMVETANAPGGLGYTRTVQADRSGRPMSEHWVLHGAGHAWSGGDLAGSYTDPRGPDASVAMLRFFRHHTRGGRG